MHSTNFYLKNATPQILYLFPAIIQIYKYNIRVYINFWIRYTDIILFELTFWIIILNLRESVIGEFKILNNVDSFYKILGINIICGD